MHETVIGLGVVINQNLFKEELNHIISSELGYYKQRKLLIRVQPFNYDKGLWKAELQP